MEKNFERGINRLHRYQEYLCIDKGYYICSRDQIDVKNIVDTEDNDYFDFSAPNHYWKGIDYQTEKCRKYLSSSQGYIYTISTIVSDDDEKFLMCYAGDGYYRIWLNGVLLTDFPYTKNDEDGSIVKLEKGNNILICELDIKKSTFFKKLKVNLYRYESVICQKGTYLETMVKAKERGSVKPVFSINNDKVDNFMLVKNDLSNGMVCHYAYSLVNVETLAVDYRGEAELYEPIAFPELPVSENRSGLYYFDIYCDSQLEMRSLVLFNTIDQEIAHVGRKLQHYKCTEEMRINIQGKIDEIKQSNNQLYHNSYFYSPNIYLFELLSIYYAVDKGIDDLYYASPMLYHFVSELDSNMENIGIFIPGGYDHKYEHKLVVLNTTGPDHYALFERYRELDFAYRDQHIIFASFTCKGVTTGGYIGEASFLECFNKVISLFNIDLGAVYLHGTSNGAYSTWALAEAYPHLFAAISPISGVPVKSMLVNLSNMYIYNIHENRYDGLDVYGTYNYPNYVFETNGFNFDKQEYIYEGHVDLYKYIWHSCVIDKLLEHKRIEYPTHIRYVSNNARHTKAYYIELLQVERTASAAEIDSAIENNVWTITSRNIISVKLFFPPYVKGKCIKLCINGNKKDIEANQDFIIVDCYTGNMVGAPDQPLTIWNLGLLSVYMDKLNIIIPNAGGAEEKIAHNFASPQSAGFISKINVEYPIYIQSDVDQDILTRGNLIIIGHGFTNNLIVDLIKKSSVHFQQDGHKVTYNGQDFDNTSSLMYVTPHPYNLRRSILFIDYFDKKTYKNNIFLRRLCITSVSNGFNSYLNQSVLLWQESKVYVAKELGDEIFLYDKYIELVRNSQYTPVVSWRMNQAVDRMSFQCTNVTETNPESELFQGIGFNHDPYCIAENKSVNADKIKFAYIDYKNDSGSCVAQLFFSQTSKYDYSEEKSVFINTVPYDTLVRRYMIDLTNMNAWKGDIRSIRLDPFSYDSEKGRFAIAEIGFTQDRHVYNSHKMFAPVQGINGWYYMKYIGTNNLIPLYYNQSKEIFEDNVSSDVYVGEQMQGCSGRLGSARVWVSQANRSYMVKIDWEAPDIVPGEQLIIKCGNESYKMVDIDNQSGSIELTTDQLNTGEMLVVILKSSEYIGKVEAKICIEIN